jgi:hypothetical protein
VLHRALRDWGYACEVIAPSLIPKRAGVHRKHDKRDAAHGARFQCFVFPDSRRSGFSVARRSEDRRW